MAQINFPIFIENFTDTHIGENKKEISHWGAKRKAIQLIQVGSKKYSHELAEIKTEQIFYKRYRQHKNVIVFRISVNRITIKELIFSREKTFEHPLETIRFI